MDRKGDDDFLLIEGADHMSINIFVVRDVGGGLQGGELGDFMIGWVRHRLSSLLGMSIYLCGLHVIDNVCISHTELVLACLLNT